MYTRLPVEPASIITNEVALHVIACSTRQTTDRKDQSRLLPDLVEPVVHIESVVRNNFCAGSESGH